MPAAFAQPSGAQAYPERPIKLVVGYSAGGPTDNIARLFAQEIGARLGKPVVIENKPGANGNIATELVQRAAPDGYTLLINSLSHNVNPLLEPDRVKYDPVKDFTPISRLVTGSQLLVVGNGSSLESVDALLRKARAEPGVLSYGSAGVGSAAHLITSLLEQRSSTRMNHIPFKGTGPALADVMAGRVDFMFMPVPAAAELARSGKLRILATTAAKRSADFPSVPTFSEIGFQGFGEYDHPLGLVGPAGIDPAIVKKIDDAVVATLADPAVGARIRTFGIDVAHLGPAEYSRWLASDRQRWAQLIERSNIRAKAD